MLSPIKTATREFMLPSTPESLKSSFNKELMQTPQSIELNDAIIAEANDKIEPNESNDTTPSNASLTNNLLKNSPLWNMHLSNKMDTTTEIKKKTSNAASSNSSSNTSISNINTNNKELIEKWLQDRKEWENLEEEYKNDKNIITSKIKLIIREKDERCQKLKNELIKTTDELENYKNKYLNEQQLHKENVYKLEQINKQLNDKLNKFHNNNKNELNELKKLEISSQKTINRLLKRLQIQMNENQLLKKELNEQSDDTKNSSNTLLIKKLKHKITEKNILINEMKKKFNKLEVLNEKKETNIKQLQEKLANITNLNLQTQINNISTQVSRQITRQNTLNNLQQSIFTDQDRLLLSNLKILLDKITKNQFNLYNKKTKSITNTTNTNNNISSNRSSKSVSNNLSLASLHNAPQLTYPNEPFIQHPPPIPKHLKILINTNNRNTINKSNKKKVKLKCGLLKKQTKNTKKRNSSVRLSERRRFSATTRARNRRSNVSITKSTKHIRRLSTNKSKPWI